MNVFTQLTCCCKNLAALATLAHFQPNWRVCLDLPNSSDLRTPGHLGTLGQLGMPHKPTLTASTPPPALPRGATKLEDPREEQRCGPDATPGQLPARLCTLKARRAKLQEAQKQLASQRIPAPEKGSSHSDVSAQGSPAPLVDPRARLLSDKQRGYAAHYTPVATAETRGGVIMDAAMVGNNWS